MASAYLYLYSFFNKSKILPINAASSYSRKTFRKNTTDEEPAKVLRVPVFNYSSTETKNPLTWKAFMNGNEMIEPELPFSYSVSDICDAADISLVVLRYHNNTIYHKYHDYRDTHVF